MGHPLDKPPDRPYYLIRGEFPPRYLGGHSTMSPYGYDRDHAAKDPRLEAPAIPTTGQKFKDWAWKPEGYFNKEESIVPLLFDNVERILFQWKAKGQTLEVPDPCHSRQSSLDKNVTIYMTGSGNEFHVRNTWDVMINLKRIVKPTTTRRQAGGIDG